MTTASCWRTALSFVEPPLFNAILLWSTHALAEIAEILGEDHMPFLAHAKRIHEGLLNHPS
jgi:hypothetical protein